MLEVGWSELLVIAIVLIVVVGPKDLPKMLRTFGSFMRKARGMASDFQAQFNDALKEAELDEIRKSIDEVRGLNPRNAIRDALDPLRKAGEDVRRELNQSEAEIKAKAASASATPAVTPAPAAAPAKVELPEPAMSLPQAAPEVAKPVPVEPAAVPAAAAALAARPPVAKRPVAKPRAAKPAPDAAAPAKPAPDAAPATKAAKAPKPKPKPAKASA
jgi:sec-independent protein translocase protein TatB